MTHTALAALMGKDKFYVSRRIGSGDARKVALDMADLELIAKALDMPVEKFLASAA